MRYEVTYSLSSDPSQTLEGGFASRTDMNNLKIIVEANGSNQARNIVESMFGGLTRCRTSAAYPV